MSFFRLLGGFLGNASRIGWAKSNGNLRSIKLTPFTEHKKEIYWMLIRAFSLQDNSNFYTKRSAAGFFQYKKFYS
jgi:hypothetical protein